MALQLSWLKKIYGKFCEFRDSSVSYRTRNIFVPGGQPEFTYVNRTTHGLEESILAAKDNLCKLVTVTGPTKSGKSVLTKRVYPEGQSVWIDGGSIKVEDDLWSQVLESLDEYTTTSRSEQENSMRSLSGGASVEAGMPVLGKAKANSSVSASTTSTFGTGRSRTRTMRPAALQALINRKIPLIIDDFHYLSKELQAEVIRALKAPIFKGLPCLILAIPHRRYDAIRVEREMTGRVQQVSIPEWTKGELRSIPDRGLPMLNLRVESQLVEILVGEALGSPHLVQEFFRELCLSCGFDQTAPVVVDLTPKTSIDDLLSEIAVGLSRPVFEALAKGPRQRTDRKKRRFQDGREGDIYVAVLNAIAELNPGRGALDYLIIRGKLRELLEELPQVNEVSRVLEHMSSIQVSDGSSAPVLDWDKVERRLHITDPYFAFFLKWGADLFRKAGTIATLN